MDPLQELLHKRTTLLSQVQNDWVGDLFRNALGGSVLCLTGLVAAIPSWPLVVSLGLLATVWVALKVINYLNVRGALLDDNTSRLVVQVAEDLKRLDARFTILSNRLGSHTGISLSQAEPRKHFNRLGG